MALLGYNADKRHVWPWSCNKGQTKWQQMTWRWPATSVTMTRKTTNTKVTRLLLKFRLSHTAPTCFWSSCCLLFIGGPVGTWTGETFDVFENVVFPLWNIVGLALGSVGAYNKNIYGRSASTITTSVYLWRKPSTLNVSYLNPSVMTTVVQWSTFLIQMIFMPQLPTPNHTIKPTIKWPSSTERPVIKVHK